MVLGVAVLWPASASAQVSGGTITSSGPLTSISTSADLNCAINHVSDSHGELFGDTACGTLVATGGTLYGPEEIPAGGLAKPRTPWTKVSQTSGGAGTGSNPYRIVTSVRGGPLEITQSDTYAVGVEYYGTKVTVQNATDTARTITVYRVGDCYLQDSDFGYGAVDTAARSVSCTAGQTPGSRIEQWAPLTPGSRYAEAHYSEIWEMVGSQQPLPDTCECDIRQDNGAGLSWTVTLRPREVRSFSHLTAFSPTGVTDVRDTDGDSFPDRWEQAGGGVDTDGDGLPDLALADYGATPDKKDVFVQVGWTRTRTCAFLSFLCSDRTHRPSLPALRDVQTAFAAQGIRLHIDAGPDSLMNPDTGATWGALSQVSGAVAAPTPIAGYDPAAQRFDWTASFDGYKDQLMQASRRRIFHFALYVGQHQDQRRSASGEARPTLTSGYGAGADFLISGDVEAFGTRMDRLEEAGTFMHELGHNLGLSHGGSNADALNAYKPNYPSVMNYLWQMIGVPKNDAVHLLDYSEGTLEPVNGAQLDEAAGLGPDAAAGNVGTSWFCPDNTQHAVVPSVRDVDWNCSANPAAPVHAIYPSYGVMTDQNDWQALVFDGNGALGGSGDASVAAPSSETVDIDPATAGFKLLSHVAVGFTGPEQLTMRAGSAASISLRLTNPHATKRTYTLTPITNGVTLPRVPATVTLAAGEVRTLRVDIQAGAVNPDAFAEVGAVNATDPSDAASAKTEVNVVGVDVIGKPSCGVAVPKRVAVLKGRGVRTGKVRILARSSKRLGVIARRSYRVRLTRGCTTIASGRVRNRQLVLTVTSIGTKLVQRRGKPTRVKVYPRLAGKYVLRAGKGGPKVAVTRVTFVP